MNRTYITTYSFLKLLLTSVLLIIAASSVHAQEEDSLEYVVYKYETGAVSSEGYLRDGKPDSYWKSYYRNGNLKTEGNRKNFLLDGEWKFYDQKGNLTLSIEYKEDIKDGLRKTFVKGITVKEEPFVEGKREGILKVFTTEGIIKEEIPFKDDLESGPGYQFDSLGVVNTLKTYKSGVMVRKQPINRFDRLGRKQGTWMEFYPNRLKKVEGTYRNDFKNGYWKYYKKSGDLIRTEFWIDGVLQENEQLTQKVEIRKEINPQTGLLSTTSTYVDGVKSGVQKEYNEEGKISKSWVYVQGIKLEEGGYIDERGRKQGHWKAFYADGSLKHEGDYRDGERTGNWIYYYPDGKVEQKGRFSYDKPEDTWTWLYPDGSTWKEEEFAGGLEDGLSVEYDSSGAIIAKGEYIEGLKEGEWFYEVGDHREVGEYFEGERVGEWVHTYTDIDQTQFRGSYETGKENGFHIYFYPNGQVKRRGNYSFGLSTGMWEYYTEDGLRYLTIEYNKAGEEVRYNGVKIKDGRRG